MRSEEKWSHSVGEDLQEQRREWVWISSLDAVFGPSAALGNLLVSVCAGKCVVQVGPSHLSEDWL
jgi:hypothetical protein